MLDTTVLIDALRGRPVVGRLRALRSTAEAPRVCAINVEEIWRGVRAGEEQAVKRLFDGLRLAPLGRPEGERAGACRRNFAQRGITLAQADCLIAAAAATVGARLATGNPKDFPTKVQLEHWPVDR